MQQYIAEHNEQARDFIIAGVDSNQERCKEVRELFSIDTFRSVGEALQNGEFDSVIISTSPLSHASIIKECLQNNLNVFTELNLVADGYDEVLELAKANNKVLFLSSTPMYRNEMIFIKNSIGNAFKGEYHYHVGQYLPEWHPWEDYRNFFVSNKRTDGCRELFAIELPWLIDTFGEIQKVFSLHKKMSTLEIDYDDSYTVAIEHESGVIGNLSIDIVTPKAGREFEVWGENKYIEWKGTPDSLKTLDPTTKELTTVDIYSSFEHRSEYNKFVVENAYYDELVNYIGVIEGREQPKYSFEKDREILKIIDKIEE